ncbi:MAG: hypothetical protein AAB438_01505 [Patescibacteria group bacterium]
MRKHGIVVYAGIHIGNGPFKDEKEIEDIIKSRYIINSYKLYSGKETAETPEGLAKKVFAKLPASKKTK